MHLRFRRENRLGMTISLSIIKRSICSVSSPLTHIVNLSITHGIVPDELKIARVIPIFKSGDKALFSNYRPISVLPCFSKFLERIIYNRIINYLNDSDVLCDNQYGFRKIALLALRLSASRTVCGTRRGLWVRPATSHHKPWE